MNSDRLNPVDDLDDYLRLEGDARIGGPDLWRDDDYNFPVDRFDYLDEDSWLPNTRFLNEFYLSGGMEQWF